MLQLTPEKTFSPTHCRVSWTSFVDRVSWTKSFVDKSFVDRRRVSWTDGTRTFGVSWEFRGQTEFRRSFVGVSWTDGTRTFGEVDDRPVSIIPGPRVLSKAIIANRQPHINCRALPATVEQKPPRNGYFWSRGTPGGLLRLGGSTSPALEMETQLAAPRQRAHTGRPWGSAEFIHCLEKARQRGLAQQKRGPREKIVTDRSQPEFIFEP